ncbi:glycoside hydrolase [Bacillus cereus]|nr:glycoside hydrolase [Bacillus cereus]PGN14714.1 glycoside hydrolase [Bacillus cereus]
MRKIRRINVVHIITGLSTGGAEMMLYKLLKNMDKEQFQPIVISLTNKGSLGEKIEGLGIKVWCCNLDRGFNATYRFSKLISLLYKFKPDIIQGWMYHGNLISQLLKPFFPKTKIVWNIRGSHYDLKQEKKTTAAIIYLCAKMSIFPSKIINNSSLSAIKHEELLGYKKSKRIIIPNGFDTDMYKPSCITKEILKNEYNLSTDTITIAIIGRYHPVKGHDVFIKAVKQVIEIKRECKFKFIFIGRDVDSKNKVLVKMIKAANIEKYCLLLGERNDIQELLKEINVIVSASHSEGFSNVIGEAMSCGIPCIATDVGDSKWIISETGFIVPPNDPQSLAEGLLKILDLPLDERQKLGIKARERIVQNFSIEIVVKKYETLYRALIK